MNKHTPGPWHASPGGETVRDANEMQICYTESDYHSIEEQDANTRLIAAAPELLEACRLVEEAWAGTGEMSAAVDAVLLAVAKAEAKETEGGAGDSLPIICTVCKVRLGDTCQCNYREEDCACGGTGAEPDPFAEDGYAPCSECLPHFPCHHDADGFCIWCGLFKTDGRCPSLQHPNRIRKAEK